MKNKKQLMLKARNLYVTEGLAYRNIGKELKLKRWQTIQKWGAENKWDEERAKFESKVFQKTDEYLSDTFGIDKAKIKHKSLTSIEKVLKIANAFISKAEEKFIDSATGQLKPEAIKDPEFAIFFNLFRLISSKVESSAKAMDDIACSKNKIDINSDIKLKAAGIYSAVIDRVWADNNPDTLNQANS